MASGRRAWTAARASASRAAGCDGGSGRGADPFGRQRQDHRLGPRGAADAGGGVGEDHAVLLAVPRQGPERGEGLAALVAAQRGGRRGGVAGGDLAQVTVSRGPVLQERVHAAEVDAGGVRVAGQGPGRAVLQGFQPAAGAVGDARRQRGELRLGPFGEGKDAVVVEQPGDGEDLRGAGDAQVAGPQRRIEGGPGDLLAGDVAGEHDGQRPAGLFLDAGVPAAGLAEPGGDGPGLLEGGAADRRGGPVPGMEAQGLARGRQFRLLPAGTGRPGGAGGLVRPGQPGAAGHPGDAGERQLVVPDRGEVGGAEARCPPRGSRGLEGGLQPAVAAVSLFQRPEPRQEPHGPGS